MTLDERIRRILTELAKEPSKPDTLFDGDQWLVDRGDVCALCGGPAHYSSKHGRYRFRHDAGCVVKEAQDILRDHP